MSTKLIAAIVGFVGLVIFVQSCLLGGDGDPLARTSESGAAPTATLPAQLPPVVMLGDGGAPTGSTGPSSNPSGGGTYVIKSGDTLGTIAAGFNVPDDQQAAWIAQVLQLNNLSDGRLLQVGQELRVPAAPAEQATGTPKPGGSATPSGTTTPGPSATVSPASTSSAAGGGGTYTVESGDTPYGIAANFCVQDADTWVNQLLELNDIEAGNLAIGQELELPSGTPAQCSGSGSGSSSSATPSATQSSD
jgi:LysM repeat protein